MATNEDDEFADFSVDMAAIRAALSDLHAGEEGIAIEDFDRAFRERHGLPSA